MRVTLGGDWDWVVSKTRLVGLAASDLGRRLLRESALDASVPCKQGVGLPTSFFPLSLSLPCPGLALSQFLM